MEIPCVTSALANNSLFAEPDKEVLIGETPQQYAQLVINLLDNVNLQNYLIET